ncbi:MAG: ethanolamine utilization acetate kinase EutQ [Candidatus Accumulibacter sp.]|jgi:ethanolamine utilization protein EutQ|nr:ethanolamine utilization acetate kinase EutQ [Accumulibacter sp.]
MKRLITAEFVRQEHAGGKQSLDVVLPRCIVTAEARLVAEQLGMKIVETLEPASTSRTGARRTNDAPAGNSGAAQARCTGADLAKIKAEVLSRLPAGAVSGDVVEQLVKKLAAESAAAAKDIGTTGAGSAATKPTAPGEAAFAAQTIKSGIKKVAGDSARFGLFDGAGRENQVGIVDVVGADDGSSMGAGFMSWKNCFFPWTLTYDEVDYVIEGELHIRCGGETVVGKAGDVIFIPRNTAIEFGTPSEVRFLYVAYPANWQDA